MLARVGDGDELCRSNAAIIRRWRDPKQIAQQSRRGRTSAGARSGYAERRGPAEIHLDSIVLESRSAERTPGRDDHRLDRRRHPASGQLRTLGDESDAGPLGRGESHEALHARNQRRSANAKIRRPYSEGDPCDDGELRCRIATVQVARAVGLRQTTLARRCESRLEARTALEQR